ncbi:MAG: BON domain-containing protein [Gallionella sp.]
MRLLAPAAALLVTFLLQGCLPIVAAGVGTGVVMSHERRDHRTFLEDQKLESQIENLISREFTGVMHVNVTCFNLQVLLSGEAPEEYSRAEIGKIVSRVEKVRRVINELVISSNSSLLSRSNDSLITSNVKFRFLHNSRFSPEHIKVVTENGAVYLMGIVYHAEGKAAADVASRTANVKRVVKLFDYLD